MSAIMSAKYRGRPGRALWTPLYGGRWVFCPEDDGARLLVERDAEDLELGEHLKGSTGAMYIPGRKDDEQ